MMPTTVLPAPPEFKTLRRAWMVYGTGKITKKREWEQKICIITAAAVDAKMMKTKQRCNSKGKIWFQQCILAFLCSGGRTRLGEIISYTFLAPNRYEFQNKQGKSFYTDRILYYRLNHRKCCKKIHLGSLQIQSGGLLSTGQSVSSLRFPQLSARLNSLGTWPLCTQLNAQLHRGAFCQFPFR